MLNNSKSVAVNYDEQTPCSPARLSRTGRDLMFEVYGRLACVPAQGTTGLLPCSLPLTLFANEAGELRLSAKGGAR